MRGRPDLRRILPLHPHSTEDTEDEGSARGRRITSVAKAGPAETGRATGRGTPFFSEDPIHHDGEPPDRPARARVIMLIRGRAPFRPVAQDLALIRDLALVLVTAAAVAFLFQKLKLPTVLGYLAAGVLVGPHLTRFTLVQDPENVALLAELGVLFLLFSLGLHFHLGRLRRVGGLALTAGLLEVGVMVAVGFLVAKLFSWGTTDAMFLGAILAISSTTMIVKVLGDLGRLRSPSSEAIFGILLVEDVVAVLLIALLSSISITGTVSAVAVGELLVRVAIFIVATLVLGLVVVPRVVDHIAKRRVEEVLILFVVGIAFATSMIAVGLGLSLALGAFIAGAIVAEAKASPLVERRIGPLRDVFTAVFFVSTGILVDPADVLAYWPAILVLAAITIVGKIIAVSFATFIAGYPPQQAMRAGIGMAMIGEFSFVIATLGSDLRVTAPFLFPIAVSVSAVTALVTPFLIRNADGITSAAARLAPAPLRSFAAMYSSWVDRIRPRGGEAFSGGYDMSALLRALSYGAVLLALGFVARALERPVLAAYGTSVLVRLAFYATVALVALPVAIGLWRAIRQLVRALVAVVVPPAQMGTARGAAAAAVLRNTLYVFLAIIFAVVGVAAGVAFLPSLPLLLAALVLVGAAGWLLRGSLRRLDQQLGEAVDTVFRADAPASSRDQVLNLIRERYPWDLHVENVLVPPASRASSRRVRDLLLPQRTGASIVTIEHEGQLTVNPGPDVLVHSGDTLGVMGDREQVEAARTLLTTEALPAERGPTLASDGIDIEEFEVEEGSPMSGVTLAGSRIRERTGASVVGVRREGVPILNPAPVMRLRPGDSVVVLGSPQQLEEARRLFHVQ